MPWTKSPPALIATFESVTPGLPVESRMMFGYPAAFVNGNMFMSLFQDSMILRLPDDAREEIIRSGAHVFEPMKGRPMREYVVVPPSVMKDRTLLERWVGRALQYGQSIAPKAKKKNTASKSTARRTPRRPR
jgi:TfoX/Sxy family transcriptional regulator of competence genes